MARSVIFGVLGLIASLIIFGTWVARDMERIKQQNADRTPAASVTQPTDPSNPYPPQPDADEFDDTPPVADPSVQPDPAAYEDVAPLDPAAVQDPQASTTPQAVVPTEATAPTDPSGGYDGSYVDPAPAEYAGTAAGAMP